MSKRITIQDFMESTIRPDVGDLCEVVLTTPDGQKTVWLESVYDGGSASCEGCFGDIDFNDGPDGDTETYCTDLPGGCNTANSIYKPACGESKTMLVLHRLEGNR